MMQGASCWSLQRTKGDFEDYNDDKTAIQWNKHNAHLVPKMVGKDAS